MNIPQILEAIRPGEEWSLNGDTMDGLTWLSDTTPPTAAEIDAAWPDVQAAQQEAKAARIADIQNAQAELQGLGLGDAAIATISGYPYPYTG